MSDHDDPVADWVASLVNSLDLATPRARQSRLRKNLWTLLVSAVLGTDDTPLIESCGSLDELVAVTQKRVENGSRSIASDGLVSAHPSRLVGAPLTDADLPYLYDSWTSSDRAEFWRFRGSTPHPARFRDLVFDGVQSHRLYRDRSNGEPRSYCAAYRYSQATRSAYFSYCRLGSGGGQLVGLESAIEFMSSLALQLPLQHLYIEVPAFTEGHLGDPAGFPLIPIGSYPEHVYWRGSWHDLRVYGIHAATLVGPAAELARLLGTSLP